MPRHRFFCPQLHLGLNQLAEEESHHALASLRLHRGDEVVLFDGVGREGFGIVERIDRRGIHVRVEAFQERPFEAAYRITLAVAMAKAHRQGYLIEKCTELGVAAIWPIVAERSVTRPGEAAVDKWSRRAIEAAKQAQRAWMPVVAHPMNFAEAVVRVGEFAAAAIADPDESAIAFQSLLIAQRPGSEILVFVGPEGGWSQAERSMARANGITTVRLAPTVLRAETAAVADCAAVSLLSVGGAPG
jgi:16S rRNA (uracil1498-N3)-methyltransferase